MKRISIIDCGSGNIRSVYNAVAKVIGPSKHKITVVSDKKDIENSTHIILPGVGSFKTCYDGLEKTGMLAFLEKKVIESCTPFLGICVGMQLLATRSYEKGVHVGLNWIPGEVKKILNTKENLKIPHMGWNKLKFLKENNFIENLGKKENLNKNISAYFIHSYKMVLENNSNIGASTEYGQKITAMILRDNIIGTQFHPEKSHNFGLNFLSTFIEMS